MRPRSGLGAAALVLALAACREPGGEEGGAPPGAAPRVTADVVAAELHEAEGLSRDVQTDIGAGDWGAAEAKVRRLAELKGPLEATGPWGSAIGIYDRGVDSLAARTARRDTVAALISANDVMRGVVSLMERTPREAPTAVGFAEVATRDALYHSWLGQWDEAEQAVQAVRNHYTAVAHRVNSEDPALDEAARREIAALEQAVEQRDVQRVSAAAAALLATVAKIRAMPWAAA